MTSASGEHNGLRDQLKQGDEQALAKIFSLHRERLWRMVHFRLDRKLQARIDPDDVLQEAYLAATQRIGHYDGKSAMSPFVWLRLIVQQTMIDVRRRHLDAQMRAEMLARLEQALVGAGPNGKKYLCILNRGPAIALGGILIDDKPIPTSASVHVESVSGEPVSTTGGKLKIFGGTKTMGSVTIEPFSVTTLIIP